ncbi:divergent polysaccharide deacetylase family protein [Thermodesulfitimonas sp.]
MSVILKEQLRMAARLAQKRGSAVAIGHVGITGANTARAIREMIPELEAQGIELVYLSNVLAGSTAYVGLDLKAGLEKGAVARVKRDVAARLKRAEPRLTRVMVTTDPDTYTRIRRVQEGIAKGKPLSAFTSELREINWRMTPETR